MTKRMLIDSTHAEETRVVVLDGNRLEDYDIETSTKHQLKGNIYLAKIVRVEPSLQAAFIEYGGNRHGFLAFGEIHPDYYQIPVADRKRLLDAQEEEAREEEERADREAQEEHRSRRGQRDIEPNTDGGDNRQTGAEHESDLAPSDPLLDSTGQVFEAGVLSFTDDDQPEQPIPHDPALDGMAAGLEQTAGSFDENEPNGVDVGIPSDERILSSVPLDLTRDQVAAEVESDGGDLPTASDATTPEQIGGEHDTDDHSERRSTPRFLRNYKIQEVIRRRQIMLVQVVKEERGSKGAALTTYISLAGRFSVLMPNSPRGGGISRKITSAADRRRLKEVTAELDLPRGMGLIVRTAGANRPKPEILRDCEYLLGQWDQIRELTMKSMAPALIYEEASLIKRTIRDMYSRDIDDILVDGEQGWRAAREFMRMLMPTHARKVQLWKDPQPLFAKAQVETQLEAILAPTVQLRSGGYLVINQTEALVAIDVNSGRSTRERGIEETAVRTNLEAADETARQLRLRDLAGLIVIDFIDMENRRNVGAVERRLKEALKDDRARIQVGSISHFGLLEMSRQRLRPSLIETNFTVCSQCGGTGHIRSTESAALHVLRAIEEEGGYRRAAEIVVHCPASIALYVLNHKRQRLFEVEARHTMMVTFAADDTLLSPAFNIERVRVQVASDMPPPVQQLAPPQPFVDPDELEAETDEVEDDEVSEAAEVPPVGETEEEGEQRHGRRRRRRRGRRDDASSPTPEITNADESQPAAAAEAVEELVGEPNAFDDVEQIDGQSASDQSASVEEREYRRRSRRGGRRRRRDVQDTDNASPAAEIIEEAELSRPVVPLPVYVGPTPADPFAGANAFDFFEAIEQAEEQRANIPARATAEPQEDSRFELGVTDRVTKDVKQDVSDAKEDESESVREAASEDNKRRGEVEVAPVISPIMIDSAAGPAEPKRGWWRR